MNLLINIYCAIAVINKKYQR